MNESSADYRVELDNFSGPLDLLLYLIRREEVDLFNIPVARITEQYVKYLELMQEMNINVAGEFIVMAATLIEIKSRMMTPEPEAMPEEEEGGDPRLELVRQLMAYKRFKEAALALTERAQMQSERFTRPGERPDGPRDLRAETPAGVSLWALIEAFNKVLDQTGSKPFHRLVLDNIPQEQIKAELEERVRTAGRISFLRVFEGQVSRPRLMGTFLALLELVKLQVMRADQEGAFGEIWLIYVPPEEREPDLPSTGEQAAAAAPVEGPAAPPEGALVETDQPEEEWPESVSEIQLPDVPEVPDAPPVPSSSPAGADKAEPAGDEEDEFDDEEDEYDDEEEDDEEPE